MSDGRHRHPWTHVTRAGRVCTVCGRWKPWKSFCCDRHGHTGRHSRCRTCCNAASAAWRVRTDYYARNQVSLTAQKKATYNPRKKKDYDLKSKYGLTLAEFSRLHERQRGQCKICRRPICKQTTSTKRRAAVVDHDHRTGEIRGLLCHTCNRALGLFNDDASLLRRALAHVG
jgi:hypothetical protein